MDQGEFLHLVVVSLSGPVPAKPNQPQALKRVRRSNPDKTSLVWNGGGITYYLVAEKKKLGTGGLAQALITGITPEIMVLQNNINTQRFNTEILIPEGFISFLFVGVLSYYIYHPAPHTRAY